MDKLKKSLKRFFSDTVGGVLLSALLCAVMLALVLIFFESGGEFIYEGF